MVGKIVGEGPKQTYWIDNRQVSKEEFDRAFPDKEGVPGMEYAWDRPLLSDALAVHPSQIEEAREDAKQKGVPTDFTPDGRPILTSRAHRKRYLKAYGFHDKQGGYGD